LNVNEPATHQDERLALITAHEAAVYLRVSLSTLHRMERSGQLTPLRTPGGHRRYTVAMLNECLLHSAALQLEENHHGTG
jgi:excisionase family DNA binding protein